MSQPGIEIVLMRQLASYLAVPILIVDRNRDLLFFNEPAEPILGRRFDETGKILREEWASSFRPSDVNGVPIAPADQPLTRATERGEPSHQRFMLTGLDGVARIIEGVAFPLATRESGLAGAVGVFWEVRERIDVSPPVAPDARRSRHPVEVILLRRLADRLQIPIFVTDADGHLLFYNPAAEPLIGRPFAAFGPVALGDWYAAFQPTGEDGSPIKIEEHPMSIARLQQQPCHRRFLFQGLDGTKRRIDATAFPLLGQCDRHLGAVGIFWEGASCA